MYIVIGASVIGRKEEFIMKNVRWGRVWGFLTFGSGVFWGLARFDVADGMAMALMVGAAAGTLILVLKEFVDD